MGEDRCKLFVAKLAWAATEDLVKDEFSKHGKVLEYLMTDFIMNGIYTIIGLEDAIEMAWHMGTD